MTGGEGFSLGGFGPYVTILIAATLPTYIWRFLGVMLAGKMSDDGELFVWVKAVATALVAAVIARLILFPTGPLGDLDLAVRVGAAAFGLFVYIVSRERLVLGVLAAELVLLVGWLTLL